MESTRHLLWYLTAIAVFWLFKSTNKLLLDFSTGWWSMDYGPSPGEHFSFWLFFILTPNPKWYSLNQKVSWIIYPEYLFWSCCWTLVCHYLQSVFHYMLPLTLFHFIFCKLMEPLGRLYSIYKCGKIARRN
jgi:hypothetical protein